MANELSKEEPISSQEIAEKLAKRGHVVTSWEDLPHVTMDETGIETISYRIGMPDDNASPTVFKLYFPPNCRVEAHTHSCNYSEIILDGSQKVSGKWLYKGDIRVGLANKGYGPLIAGPEGASILVIFADGNWPAISIGAGDGSTINASKLLEQFSAAES
tara:strand:- start:1001 stop:1480 length:480 start_codon:yes stop_codon:yes gene_type:complete